MRAFHRFTAISLLSATTLPSFGQAYVPPVDGPLAEVTLKTLAPYGTDLVVYKEAEGCKGLQFVQSPKDIERTTKVRAGVKTSFSVTTPYFVACTVAFQFTPQERAKYYIEFANNVTEDGTVRSAKCTASVNRIADNGDRVAVPDLVQLKSRNPWFLSGSFCDAQ